MTSVSRFSSMVLVLALAASACSGDDAAPDSTTAPVTSSSTVVDATTTTTSVSNHTVPETTSTTVVVPTSVASPVTEGEALPSALSRTAIPFDEVDTGWVLALYSADQVIGSFVEGPIVLYLVSPDGDRYEVTSWPAGAANRPWEVLALANDGRTGLLTRAASMDPDAVEVVRVNLETGGQSLVYQSPALATVRGGFSLPDGDSVAVAVDTGEADILNVVTSEGDSIEMVRTRSYPRAPIAWLYGVDGELLVIGDANGLRLVTVDGVVVRALESPGRCIPVRWWDVTTVLAACIPPSAPADSIYRRLFTIPLSGERGAALTLLPEGFDVIGDFGYSNAWEVGNATVMQWHGDCSALGLHDLSRRVGEPIVLETEYGPRVVTVTDDALIVHGISGCGDYYGPLLAIGTDGTTLRTLVPRVSDDHSAVISAAGMILVP
ncbi:hypothetical protein HQ535_04180 [bacterium]|nr:hypothetical protein [bacterium]